MINIGSHVMLALALAMQAPEAAPLELMGRFEDRRIDESSGIVVSRHNPGVLWTHNDSGDGPYLYAVDSTGRALGRLRVTGAVARDWEDIATGPCPDDMEAQCLFIADTGDNIFIRPLVTIYAVRDPTPPVQQTERALALALQYPDGSRDVEAMFVDGQGTLHLITKGNRGSIDHYAVSRSEWGKQTVVTARYVQAVGIRATRRRLVTGAALSPSGREVAIRSRRFVYLFAFDGERLGDTPIVTCAEDLLTEGESVDFLSEDVLVLTTEAGQGEAAPLYRLPCGVSSSGQ